jgi:hypothetical protein
MTFYDYGFSKFFPVLVKDKEKSSLPVIKIFDELEQAALCKY